MMFIRNPLLVVLSLLFDSIVTEDPCFTTLQINDRKRSVTYSATSNLCDSSLLEGWYRITSATGELMPTSCPKLGFKCGTIDPIWLSSENISPGDELYPYTGQTVNRTCCMSHFDGNCCKEKYAIRIKNCGCFYVYYLPHTSSCMSAFCFGISGHGGLQNRGCSNR